MSAPAHRDESAQLEYGFPQGHLGHLTLDEEEAFKNFKLLCAENGYYKSADGDAGRPSHDDSLMLRFLRARRFVVADAYEQFKDTEDWRKANQLDDHYETMDLEHYEETWRLYPQWTGRRDRRGIPVYVFEIKHLTSKAMSEYEKTATSTKAKVDSTVSPKLIRLCALYEHLTRFVLPLCTALTDRDNPRTPITQSSNIVDISGVGLKQFWNLRGHMQDASALATARYPETLDRIFIIGAPAFFPTVWGWIKKWFDPVTTSKIFILSAADMQTTLESFIDPANIPKRYRGQLDFEFGSLPVLDPAAQKVIQWEDGQTDFPNGPLYWDQIEGGRFEEGKGGEKLRAIAVGSIGEKQRKEAICTMERVLEPLTTTSTNASTATDGSRAVRPELLGVPTATNETSGTPIEQHVSQSGPENQASATDAGYPFSASSDSSKSRQSKDTSRVKLEVNGQDQVAVQEGKIVPAPRPEPVSFVTASEGVQTLSLDEKAGNLENASHQTATAHKLDPNIPATASAA